MSEREEHIHSGALAAAEQSLHIYEGLVTSLADPHAVLEIVLEADDPASAVAVLGERFDLDEVQATAVTEMQYRRLSRSEREKIRARADELRRQVADLTSRSESD